MKKILLSFAVAIFALAVILPVQTLAEPASITFGNVVLYDGEYTDNGENRTSTPPESGNYAYFNNGVLELWGITATDIPMIKSNTDLTIDVKNNSVISVKDIRGIYVNGDLTITGKGDLTVTCNDNLSANSQLRAAIYANSVEITLDGNMYFESKSEHDYTLKVAGIYADSNIDIKSGYVQAIAGVPYSRGGKNAGLWAENGKVTINNAQVWASSRVLQTVYNTSYGIYGSCEINGVAESKSIQVQGNEAAFSSTVTFGKDFAYEYRHGYTGSWKTDGNFDRSQKYAAIKEHICTPGENWVAGDTTHWKECACGRKVDEAAHLHTESKTNCDVCGTLNVVISAENFPDVDFMEFVANYYDTDKNGRFSQAELDAVTKIDCSDNSIASLQGIEYFAKLETLDCSDNQFTELDLSKNTKLIYLYCGWSGVLKALDVSRNTALEYLDCQASGIAELDVSKNTALTYLTCNQNKFTELDISQNTALKVLHCYGNELTELDLSNNTALTHLMCCDTLITELDLSNNTELIDLDCSNNQLTALDVSKNTKLTDLHCYGNELTELDLSNNTELIYLNCGSNQLTALDVSKNTKLRDLDCSYNQLTSLNLSANTALTSLNSATNQLEVNISTQKTFDLTALPGNFDVNKASDWTNGIVNGNILTVTDTTKNVTYTYDCGNGKTAEFTLTFTVEAGTMGDINADGVVDVLDADLVYGYCNGGNSLTAAQMKTADISGDKQVSLRDAMMLYDLANEASEKEIKGLYVNQEYEGVIDTVIGARSFTKSGNIPEGMEIKGSWDNLSGYYRFQTILYGTPIEAGTFNFSITYLDDGNGTVVKKVNYTVTVSENELSYDYIENITLVKWPTKLEYDMGEAIDTAGMQVKATVYIKNGQVYEAKEIDITDLVWIEPEIFNSNDSQNVYVYFRGPINTQGDEETLSAFFRVTFKNA